jgi:Holliday junction resolvasome RuvABC endonuclease subunit
MALDIRRATGLLRQLLKLHEQFRPRQVVVERLDGTKTARTATTFGIVTGVLASFLEYTHLPVSLISALDVKKRLTGVKSASKEQMIRTAVRQVPSLFVRAGFVPNKKGKWPDKVEHIADAYGLFLTASEGPDLRQLLQLAEEFPKEGGIN